MFLHDEASFNLDEDLQFSVIIAHVTGVDYSAIHYNDRSHRNKVIRMECKLTIINVALGSHLSKYKE